MRDILDTYIAKRWKYWLQYSQFRCQQGGIASDAEDVLQEVVLSLMTKNTREYLLELQSRKTDNGTNELDALLLRMVDLNATSDTSRYRYKYKPSAKDLNTDVSTIELIDEEYDGIDESQILLDKIRQVREIFETLDISDKARRIFSYRFFEDEKFSEWEGKESQQELYNIYNDVENLIRKTINGELLF